MEETKKCPKCGQEVLAVAKKCKHCGYWFEPKETVRCPICFELIPKDAEVCPMCHERIKPAEENENESVSPEPETITGKDHLDFEPLNKPEESSSEVVVTTDLKGTGKKKGLIFVLALIVLAAVLFGLFHNKTPREKSSKEETSTATVVKGGKDAAQLHSFFFNALCEPIQSLSQNDIMSKRLKKLLKKNQIEFIENNLSVCSPVYLKFDDDGNAVFSFYGTKNATTSPETYTVNYTDIGGGDGWFDVITVIDGKRNQAKESVKQLKATKSSIREWHYTGTMGKKNKKDVEFTLYVDGPGDVGDMVKGAYQEKGSITSIPLSGFVRTYANSSTLILSTPKNNNDFIFTLYPFGSDEIKDINLDIALCLEGVSESTGEDINLLRENMLDIDYIRYANYEGRLFGDDESYPIGMELAINSADRENEIVSGFYYYKRKGRKNFIRLNGYCSHGSSSSSIATLCLQTTKEQDELFMFEEFGDIWGKAELRGGTWTRYQAFSETVDKELEIELKNKSH